MKVDQDTWRILRTANLCKLYKDYNRLEKAAQKKDSNRLKMVAYTKSHKSIKIQQR